MASAISAAGVGSGLDIESLISSLLAVERRPLSVIETQQTSYQSRLSAFGTLKGSLSALQTAAEAIASPEKFSAFKASVADTTVANASATGSAAAGSFSLEVTQLAQAQKLKSTGFAASTSSISTGTLTLELGEFDGSSFTADADRTQSIVIDASNNTLAGLRDAINASGAGVTATLVNDGSASPVRLVLTSADGTANTVRLSGLSGFDFDPEDTAGSTLSQIQPAANAEFTLDGIAIEKSSNVVTDAIEGVTLTLAKTNTGAPTTLSIATDTSAITDRVNAFVNAYNGVVNQIRTQTAYNPDTRVSAALSGDATVRSIQTQLRSIVGGTLSGGSLTRLADIGIDVNVDGTLTLNSSEFSAALTDPTNNVAAVFGTVGGVDGFATQLADRVESFLGTDGLLTSRTDGLNATLASFDERIEAFELRLEQVEARYRRQFTVLDATIASLNSTSTYLTQQLAALNG